MLSTSDSNTNHGRNKNIASSVYRRQTPLTVVKLLDNSTREPNITLSIHLRQLLSTLTI